jgi:plasmid stabilization system protein ParE
MSLAIRFAVEAEETYDSIVNQLRGRWGDKFVLKFEDKVFQVVAIIAQTPLIYPIAQENSETRKCVLHKNCSMFYKVNEHEIEIVYFWDNRQDPLINF